MQNAADMASTQAPNNLDKDIPDLLLLNVRLTLLIVANLLKHIPVVSILHHKTQTRCRLVDECITVGNNIWMVDRS